MKTIISFAIFFIISFSATTKTYYVSPSGNGKATSWKDASSDLNAVLFAAVAGDEIWVAEGTYLPTLTNNRNIAFVINSGIKVYGGFEGNETNRTQRNHKKNVTILSGDIGSIIAKDNSYTVVYLKNANSETTLDGFIIEGGFANGANGHETAVKCGGGLFNDGSGERGQSTPIIANCIFQNNYSRDGGAVYNYGLHGNASPTFTNCIFQDNRTDLDGGAIYNNGRKNGKSNPIFNQCQFLNNEGNYGGAMLNYGGAGESIPVLTNCTFEGNESYMKGDIFFNINTEGVAYPEIYDLISGGTE